MIVRIMNLTIGFKVSKSGVVKAVGPVLQNICEHEYLSLTMTWIYRTFDVHRDFGRLKNQMSLKADKPRLNTYNIACHARGSSNQTIP